MRYILISICLLNLLCAQSNEPQVAPLNPKFIKYQEDKKNGLIHKINSEGYFNSIIPHPTDRKIDIPKNFKVNTSLPARYDLRDDGFVTPVKNQGQCGSCWLFATMGSLESYWKKLGLGIYDLSENHAASEYGFEEDPCEGGNSRILTPYLVRGDGPISEADDPYTLGKAKYNPLFTPQGIVTDARLLPNDVDIIKQWIYDYGGVYSSFLSFGSFYDHYDQTKNTYFYSSIETDTTDWGHAIVLVGWDDNMQTAGGTGVWIAKNSWGNNFGENGYFYFSYQDVFLNVEGYSWATCWPGRIDYNDNLTIYYYDKFGWIGSLGWSDGPDYALVKYVVNGNETVTRVGTYVSSTNSTVKFEIYDSFTNNSLGNLLASTNTFNCDYPGYYSFDLPIPLALSAGKEIYVKVEYSTPGYNWPIPVEQYNANWGWTFNPQIETGCFWLSNTGDQNTWLAYGNNISGKELDPCVKLYTMSAAQANTTPNASFTVSPTSGTVNTVFNFNASGSTDNEDLTSALQVRWDWNNDGTYDTNYSTTKTITHQYNTLGTHTVKLEVQDSGGLINTTTKTIETVEQAVVITLIDEGFDTAPFPPAGWTQDATNTNNTWQRGNVQDNYFSTINTNSQSSAICPYDDNVDQNEWLYSPELSLPNGTVSLEFYSGYSTNWLTGASMSCWITINSGTNWTKIWEAENDGLPWSWRKQEIDLSAYAGNQNVYLAWGYVGRGGDIVGLDGVKLLSNGTVGIENINFKLESFSLEQNFPNPFNPTTAIHYYVPFDSPVIIIIYDLMGREVNTIVNDNKVFGNHITQWNGKDNFGQTVSGGIYFYKLQAGDFSQTRKMLLLK